MSKLAFRSLMALLAVAIIMVAVLLFSAGTRSTLFNCDPSQHQRLEPGLQTSASYLYQVALLRTCETPTDPDLRQRFELASDIYIKARSYALLNKSAFWTSLAFALLIFGIPLAHAAREAPETDGTAPSRAGLSTLLWRLLGPTQIPAITLLAGLSFTLYDNYKQKQSEAESLLRHVVFSNEETAQLSLKVIETLAVIDTGFSFSNLLSASAPSEAEGPPAAEATEATSTPDSLLDEAANAPVTP